MRVCACVCVCVHADFSLAGAVEYQPLHRDGGFYEGPAQGVTLNFNMVDHTGENGPIRQIPGSHRWDGSPPMPDEEPQYMKYSFVKPLKAGGVIFRDLRCWHGGSPNCSDSTRALPNVEYSPPPASKEEEQSLLQRQSMRTMPFENWLELSETGKHLARFTVLEKDETPPQLFPHEWEGKAIPDRRAQWQQQQQRESLNQTKAAATKAKAKM
jgi:ectoine hydroxylase-related dioxygenase (phytanoyl-CoA dioxygenase family)